MLNSSTSRRRPEMLGAFPGFRREEDFFDVEEDVVDEEEDDDDGNNTLTDSQVYLTPSPDRTDTVAASSGSQGGVEEPVEEQPAPSRIENKDESCWRRHCHCWLCCFCLVAILVVLVCLVVAWFLLLADNNDGSSNKTMTPTLSPSLAQVSTLETTKPTFSVHTQQPTWNDTHAVTTSQPTTTTTATTTIESTNIPQASSRPTATPTLSASPSVMPSAMPSSENFTAIVQQIQVSLGLEISTDDINDKESAQYKAVEWLADKDQVLSNAARATNDEFRYGRRLAQRYSLALLYFSTQGDKEGKWKDQCSFLNETLHECEWKCRDSSSVMEWTDEDQTRLTSKNITYQGVHCYGYEGFRDEIEHLVLVDNGLSGSLPSELSELIAVRALWLFSNDLTGGIPDALFAIPFLEEVRLESNALTGPAFPSPPTSAIWFLRDWRAANNSLTGQLQMPWQTARRLEVLDLGFNDLTGTLSDGLWSMPSLRRVAFPSNMMNGTLPDSLGEQLEQVNLEMNQFSGALPVNLDDAQGLVEMNVRDNSFTGGVPESWAGLANLEMLDVSGNPGLQGNLEFFCGIPRAGQSIYSSCGVLPCSCCLCV